ncbi:PLP-dependent aminotransferase family protein [Nocardia sp. NPDC127579]|uniref:aminotransferase-like domain-containing protein n=1 Tax=Nocardia sp. NPDC127579 TaxID=3345402 RepID=UPI00363BF719
MREIASVIRPEVISLACAAPDAPPPEIAAAYARIVPELAGLSGEIGYHPAGYLPLRVAIAERYTRLGAPTRPEQILVTNGGQQGLTLLARALLRPGDRVVLETPTYPGALEAFREASAVLRPLPLGLTGFRTAVRSGAALAYVTPTFQNPTGTVLSRLVRRGLAEAAAAAGIPLIVDEVLAELAFPGAPELPPTAADVDSVITVGSLSKSLWGGLRVGWVRADPATIARLARLRAVGDLGGNLPAQMAATGLVADLDSLCRAQALTRKAAHDSLIEDLAVHLPQWPVAPVPGGQSLWIPLPHGDGASFAQTALRHDIAVLAGNGLDPTGSSDGHIRLHFRHPRSTLRDAVLRLAAAWADYRPPARISAPAPAFAI